MRETAREVAEKIVWAWSADDESYYQSDLIDRVAAVLTAERAARERAERERDTLRQHTAVLRAECQAGRVLRDMEDGPRDGATMDFTAWARRDSEAVAQHREAIAATDAAGAMGEVGRG